MRSCRHITQPLAQQQAAAAAVGEEEGAEGAQQQHDVLAVDDDDGGGDAGVESPMATSLNLTTHQLVRETKAGSTCADKWLALYSGLQKNIFDGLDYGTLAAIEQSLQKRLGRRAVPPPRRRGNRGKRRTSRDVSACMHCCPPRDHRLPASRG